MHPSADPCDLPTLPEILRARAELHGDRVAFWQLGGEEARDAPMTFGALHARAMRVAGRLHELGARGRPVLLLYPPGHEYVAGLFGCMYAGAIAVPLFPPDPAQLPRTLPRLVSVVRDSGATMALTTSTVASLAATLPVEGLGALTWVATDELGEAEPTHWEPPARDALALLQYTSGSTSSPRGVAVDHANLVENSGLVSRVGRAHPGAVVVSWLPPYHDMGLVTVLLQAVYAGLSAALMSPVDFLRKPSRWLDAISRHRATHSGGPNFAFDYCVRKVPPAERASFDLSSWEVAYVSAEPVRARTLEGFARAFEPSGFRRQAFVPAYGLAEATLIVSGAPRLDALRLDREGLRRGEVRAASEDAADELASTRVVACGGALPGHDIAIVDPAAGVRCAEERVGEIWVRGPSVARGYWRRPEDTERVFGARLAGEEGTWLRTGDLGFLREGQLFPTGRLKEVLVLRGCKHYPQDLELSVERSHPALRPGCGVAFSVEVEREEQAVVVYEIDPSADGERALAEARRALSEEHGVSPHAILLVGPRTVPKTSSGKLQRLACRAAYLAGELSPLFSWSRSAQAFSSPPALSSPPAVPAPDAPELGGLGAPAWLLEHVASASAVAEDELDPAASLHDYGFDSVQFVSLVAEIERRTGARLRAGELSASSTLEEVAELVRVVSARRRRPPSEPESPAEAGPRYRGGEDFDVLEAFTTLRAAPFRERMKLLADGAGAAFGRSLYMRRIVSPMGREVLVEDPFGGAPRAMLMFGSNDYLGLANDPFVVERVVEATRRYGAGLTGSPLLSGYTALHRELEERLADLKGAEDAVLFPSGYAANVGLVSATADRADLVVCDEYSHASFRDGLRMSGAGSANFRHNDVEHLEALLDDPRVRRARNVFVGVEGVYSMDGDLAPLDRIAPVCRRRGALLFVDDAHGTLVVGPKGRGAAEAFGVEGDVDANMGTFSKAFGVLGGFVAGSKPLVQYLRLVARSYMFSASLPPPVVATVLAGLELLGRDGSRRERLWDNVARARLGLRAVGFELEGRTPILPLRVPVDMDMDAAERHFHEAGIFLNSVRFPAVPVSQQRFRVSVSSAHRPEDIDRLVGVVADVWARCRR